MSDKIYILEATEFETEYSSMVSVYRTKYADGSTLAPYLASAINHFELGDKVVVVINDIEYVADSYESYKEDEGDLYFDGSNVYMQYNPDSAYILSRLDGIIPLSSATFAIYYEEASGPKPFTPERAGLPDMNVKLEYENPTNNGIALVTKALMWGPIQDMNDPESELTDEEIAEINDILYNPGYAPFERLAKAAAFGTGADPYAVDSERYVVDFANDWERLAFAINPAIFLKR